MNKPHDLLQMLSYYAETSEKCWFRCKVFEEFEGLRAMNTFTDLVLRKKLPMGIKR